MTTFDTIQQTLAPELRQLNDHIHAALDSPNLLMNSVINTYLEKKGSRYARFSFCSAPVCSARSTTG